MEEWIAPIGAGLIGGLTAIIGAVIAGRAKRAEIKESKMPTAEALWDETRESRSRAFFYEDAYHTLHDTFKAYISRVIRHYPDDDSVHPSTAEMEAIQPKVYPGD